VGTFEQCVAEAHAKLVADGWREAGSEVR